MTAKIARLSTLRAAKQPAEPEPIQRMRGILGLASPGAWIAWEVWHIGKRSEVMATDGRSFLNVSFFAGMAGRFANRDEARRWARAYFAGLGMEALPERQKRRRTA